MAKRRKVHIEHDEIVQLFAQRLREARNAVGMTQTELARQAGVTGTYVSRLEAAGAAPGTVQRLLTLQMESAGEGLRPFFTNLNQDGRAAWERFTQGHAAETNDPEFPSHLRGAWSKFKGYCARLALILHALRWSLTEADSGDYVDSVDGSSMEGAARLMGYFKSHARKVYAALDADERVAAAKRILQTLAAHAEEMKTFSRRDLYQHVRRYFGR